MLTDRQKLTIEHLEEVGIKKPEDIIKWCLVKTEQSKRKNRGKNQRLGRRKHSREYYREILNFYAQGNRLETNNKRP
jgi:hypothetical protein